MSESPTNLDAYEALEQLREGNSRFANNVRSLDTLISQSQRESLTEGQNPFAIILGCSDSRVPAELVFDQGFGSLFVIRVAGNVVAPSQIGSVEFAATSFNTQLVVVLGHSDCGAINATIKTLKSQEKIPSRGIRSIIDLVSPAVAELVDSPLRDQPEELKKHAVRANVRASTSHLRHGSRTIEKLVLENKLLIVGADYSIETGEVDFFDVPEPHET